MAEERGRAATDEGGAPAGAEQAGSAAAAREPSPPADDGRRGALAAMIAGEPQRLRRRAISLGVAPDDADDVAQTALLRAWRSIEHLETPEPGRMCAWLDAIARNAAADLARARARRPVDALDDRILDETDAGAGARAGGNGVASSSVADEVELRTILDGALAALHALPETVREPLLLSVVDGLSAPEIAERLGIAPAAVRQRIARARKALASCRRAGMGE